MTAKNVAIVWAPNLLRAKSLEVGGVAALQGVGVQAVVTEYLIRYCELIFSDKMPSYNTSSNPASTIMEDAALASKKLRPKSLAISTPTKLLSLEEARNRVHNLGPCSEQNSQKYIEVGGGPKSLPQKYHTVIDLPGRRSMKQPRKSPIGWKAIFKSKASTKGQKPEDLLNNPVQAVTDDDLRTALPRALLRPVKSAESLAINANVQRSQSKRRTSKSFNQNNPHEDEMMDDLCPLEAVSKAVSEAMSRDSPKTHNRSNSHDSYFEKSQAEIEKSKQNKMDSSLDLSEIQMNFDLEENEMKIFSEDEAMLTGSLDGSEDFSAGKSPLEEDIPALNHPVNEKVIENKSSSSSRKSMSFREKLKRFTSPTQPRKFDSSDSEDLNKTENKSLRERIVCALSPESLRKRDNQQINSESSPKKKKPSFSPLGTSPNNTSQLVKRSKIEPDQNDQNLTASIPLSPSINFIDASMTESFESTSKFPTTTSKYDFSRCPGPLERCTGW